ncbi:MAG: thioesterase family protein [Gemmatimonadota bacterium]
MASHSWQIIEATLRAGDNDVARATGLRIRRSETALPEELPIEPPSPGPLDGRPGRKGPGPFLPGFHSEGVEHRFIRGSLDVADFGNGISGLLPGTHTYINPDLTVYLHRYPEGEWICLDAVTHVHANGIGLAQSRLSDERGPIGCSMQSLIVTERAR